ncbi:MAG: acyl-CoA dehydratase activase-related protein, partial [Anaerolineae bacterium]|nr:acyl-CoA dehydratase activase-related protein [Anaerolineae bacterium]
YPDVIRSAIDPEGKYGIPLDMPTVTFDDLGLLKKTCIKYLQGLGISRKVSRAAFRGALDAQAAYKSSVRQAGADMLAQAQAEGRKIVLLMGHPYHLDANINHKAPQILADFGVDVITEDALPLEDEAQLKNDNLLTQWEYINRYLYAARWAAGRDNAAVVQLNSFACAPDAINLDECKHILSEAGKGLTVIRIDEIESTGSVKLRLRSMIEALKDPGTGAQAESKPRKYVKTFEDQDRHRTILAPHFSRFVAPAVTNALTGCGFKVEGLPPPDRRSVDLGLKYTNNEVCYPAILVVGDIIKALQSEEYRPEDTAVGAFMTGGQCRASCYAALVKRAMISAGFEDIPLVAVTTNKQLHYQPGFDLSYQDFIKNAVFSLLYADALAEMYYATACREVHHGEAMALANAYLEPLNRGDLPPDKASILGALAEMVSDFNAVATVDKDLPKVGIVGEIYVKYNDFSNNHAADWLINQGIEVIVPGILKFFLGWFISTNVQIKSNLKRHNPSWLLARVLERPILSFLAESAETLAEFRYHRPGESIHDTAAAAEEIVSLSHQYGEGWLISGEIGAMMHAGIENVLCLQPFGCIANQVVAKGVAKRIHQRYPALNLLFLDLDAGGSEVNFYNRMHFFIDRARQAHEKNAEEAVQLPTGARVGVER